MSRESRRLAALLHDRAAAYRADADHMEAPKLRQHTPVSSLSLSPEVRRVIAAELESCATDLTRSEP